MERNRPGGDSVGPTEAHAPSFFSDPAQAPGRMTLDSFRELFRERPRRRLGPVWHMWHFFLACVPALAIAAVCTHVERRRLKEKEAAQERAGRKRVDTTPDVSLGPSTALALQNVEATGREEILPGATETSHSTHRGAPGHEQQLHTRILELEHRLREIEAARSSGLDSIRLVLGRGNTQKELVLPLEPSLTQPAPATDSAQGSRAWAELGQLFHTTKSAFRKWIPPANRPGTGYSETASNNVSPQENSRS